MEDLTGMVFGRLTVLYRHSEDYITPSTQKRMSRWVCLCSCGRETITTSSQLKSGKTKSCGCLQRERTAKANTKHGGRYTRLHSMWANMKTRCYNPNYSEFKNYGGRGISVCEEWMDYPAFAEWAISAGYDDKAERGQCSLDRIDVNGMYCPENCRFVDVYEQMNNTTKNIRFEYKNESKTLSEWSKILGVEYDVLYYRVRTKGLTIEEALKEVV